MRRWLEKPDGSLDCGRPQPDLSEKGPHLSDVQSSSPEAMMVVLHSLPQ